MRVTLISEYFRILTIKDSYFQDLWLLLWLWLAVIANDAITVNNDDHEKFFPREKSLKINVNWRLQAKNGSAKGLAMAQCPINTLMDFHI